jgi:hypothetical protein
MQAGFYENEELFASHRRFWNDLLLTSKIFWRLRKRKMEISLKNAKIVCFFNFLRKGKKLQTASNFLKI